MRPVRWRKGALVLSFLLMASMSYMIFSSIRNRHETVLLGAAESHTTETARTLANKANEAPGRSTRTQFPPRPTPHRRKEPQIVPKTTARTIRKETEKPEENIRDKALKINRMERVLNEDRFPNHLTSPEAIILVVQVHNRANYFKYLIESLKAIRDVDRVLVIISHDLYSEEMNNLVKSIDFCRASTY